jgi:hypothetical protein
MQATNVMLLRAHPDFILCRSPLRRKLLEVNIVRGLTIQARIRPSCVVPLEVVGNVGFCLSDCGVGPEVNPFVFRTAPYPFNKHVVAPSTFAVHRQLATGIKNCFGEFFRSKLTALIGVHNIRLAKPFKCLF